MKAQIKYHSKSFEKISTQSYANAVVFMVCGGCYSESANLMRFANKNKHNPINLIYGTTDLVSPSQFLDQLTKLGKEVHDSNSHI